MAISKVLMAGPACPDAHKRCGNSRVRCITGMMLWGVLLAALCGLSSNDALAACESYTFDADFDLGVMLNVNHDAPNSNQLQLNTNPTPFPFVNIACSDRGTVVRIDVNTGAILGEYLSAPEGMGRNPSRTTVDQLGNVWVGNRNEFGGGKGSITRIGLVIGGTRCNSDGTPNPVGQYLKPPFAYSTCTDRDGDGLIKTSLGLANILPWTNAGGADVNGGVTTADDECIINYTRVTGSGTRTIAVDQNNDVWVSGTGDLDHEQIDGVTGLPVPGTQFNLGCGGYGGLIDGNGVLWSARVGGLLRFVPNATPPPAGVGACLAGPRGDYGLGVDPNTGHIWHTYLEGNRIAELDSDGNLLNTYAHGSYYAQGVAVDANGNVWVAHSLLGPSTTVGHLLTNGTYVGNIALPGGSGPTGVAVDANGKIWVANYYSHNVMRIDPTAGPIGGGGVPVGAVDLTVSLGAGAGPYNYSDMTGFVSVGTTAPSGTWTTTYDGGSSDMEWGSVCWNSEECPQPEGTQILVRVRSSADQVSWSEWVSVSNCVDFDVPDGQYLEIEVKLLPNDEGESPILCDVSVCTSSPSPPVIFCPEEMTVACASEIPQADVSLVIATSLCPPVTVEHVSDVALQNNPCSDTIVRTYRATDSCGGSTECTQLFIVIDDVSPSLECPEELVVSCRDRIPGCNPDAIGVSDNCGRVIFVSCVDGAFQGDNCNGSLVRTYTFEDECGNEATCTQTITVQDTVDPVITCPPSITVNRFEDLPICSPDLVTVDENCSGYEIRCTRAGVGGVGCTGNPIPVRYTFTATDGCGNVGSCEWIVVVAAPNCPVVNVNVGQDPIPSVLPGTQVSVPVSIGLNGSGLGEFDLILKYDRSALALLGVDRGSALEQWEYFTYRSETSADCAAPCSDGYARVIGSADITNGQKPPSTAYHPNGPIAYLRFAVAADQITAGAELSIGPASLDGLSSYAISENDEYLFITKEADPIGEGETALAGIVIPTLTVNSGRLLVADSRAIRGDLNLNGVGHEVGDAVLLMNYLIYGESTLSTDAALRERQILAGDINNDGVSSSVSDLHYLVRVIAGYADPYQTDEGAKISPSTSTYDISVRNGMIRIVTNSQTDIGAALIVLNLSGLSLSPLAEAASYEGLSVESQVSSKGARILIHSHDGQAMIPAGTRELVTIPVYGDGTATVEDLQLSDSWGGLLHVTAPGSGVPRGFTLAQNYPNPFNAGTVMQFTLENSADWTLTIYNILGQAVQRFNGTQSQGEVRIAWDGIDQNGTAAPSGVYFYQIVTRDGALSKKMTLLR